MNSSNLSEQLYKEKEKNKELETKINDALKRLDTYPYVAYDAYGELLYEDDEVIKILKGEEDE